MLRSDEHLVRRTLFRAAAILMMLLTLPSCSLIGLGAGSMIKQETSRPYGVGEGKGWSEVRPGTRVRLVLTDRSTVSGTVRRFTRETDDRYTEHFAAWRAGLTDSSVVPSIGEIVSIQTHLYPFESVRFEGLEPGAVRVRNLDNMVLVLLFEDILYIRPLRGPHYSLTVLRENVPAPPCLILGRLELTTTNGPRTVALSEMASAELLETRNSALPGFLVGLAVDVMAVVTSGSAAGGSFGGILGAFGSW